MKRLLTLLVLFITISLNAQNDKICNDPVPFASHLYETGNYDELVELIKLCPFDQKSILLQDSLNFILGRSYLEAGNTEKAFMKFTLLEQSIELQDKGVRIGLNHCLETRNYQLAISLLENDISGWKGKQNFMYYTGGTYLLQRRFQKFDSLLAETIGLPVSKRKTLLKYKSQYEEAEPRSPWMAGFLSALVPGLGKVYAGKHHEGLAAFTITSMYGIQTAEAYFRQGFKTPVFYFTGLFTLGYYIGNIWGSSLAVKRKNQEKLYEIDKSLRSKLYFDR